MHRYDEDTNELARAVLGLRHRARRDGSAAARPPAQRRGARRRRRPDHHRGGARRPRGAAHLRGGARAGHDLGRPPALPVVHPGGAHRGLRRCSTWWWARRRSTAGSWHEGAGAVFAENQALRWLADLAGLPPEAGGVFVQGGTIGNLSALVAARHAAAERRGGRPERWRVAVADSVHSSVRSSAAVMDVDVLVVPTRDQRLTGDGAARRRSIATAPTTSSPSWPSAGTHQPRASSTTSPASPRPWPRARPLAARRRRLRRRGAGRAVACAACFDGIERADSFIVDPHKWLFAPFDCCALLYRDPRRPRAAHTQKAEYLDSLQTRATGTRRTSPST